MFDVRIDSLYSTGCKVTKNKTYLDGSDNNTSVYSGYNPRPHLDQV